MYNASRCAICHVSGACRAGVGNCSAGGVFAMNNVILTKWHIALSVKTGVLENH